MAQQAVLVTQVARLLEVHCRRGAFHGKPKILNLGHAPTTHDAAETLKQLAEARAIAAALKQLGVSDATVVGHSFDTLVGIALALDHPHVVAKLVLLSGLYFPTFRPDILLNAAPAVPGTGDLIRYTFGPPLSRTPRSPTFVPTARPKR